MGIKHHQAFGYVSLLSTLTAAFKLTVETGAEEMKYGEID